MFLGVRNEFKTLENPFVDTKIASLAHLEAEILKISENRGSGR